MLLQIVEKLLLDAKYPTGEFDLGLAAGGEFGAGVAEEVADMSRFGRRSDRRDCATGRDALGGCEHRGAAQAVTDQDARRFLGLAEKLGRRHQIIDIGGEIAVFMVSFCSLEL